MASPIFTVDSEIAANESLNADGDIVYNFARQANKNDGTAR